MADVELQLDASTVLLIRDLLKVWIDDTEGSPEVPRMAMRDWHRIAAAVVYPS